MFARYLQTPIYAYCQPADMRKGIEGLSGMVREALQRDPLSGALFLFTNKTRTLAKVLHFDETGMCLLQKRLERGRFVALWNFVEHEQIKLTKSELDLFLQGSHIVACFQLAPPAFDEKELAVSV